MTEYTTCHYCEQTYPKDSDNCPYCGEQVFDIEILRGISRSILRDNQKLKRIYGKAELALMIAYGKYAMKDYIEETDLGNVLTDALCDLWGKQKFTEWVKVLEKDIRRKRKEKKGK